jgi:hypothetical protein
MPDRWIIRVAGKEYGPVDLEVLREWIREGRLLSANEARLESESQWSSAGAIPGLFQSIPLAPSQAEVKELEQPGGKLFCRTFQIYGRGFFQFLALSGLVIVPSLCGQLVSVFAERLPSNGANFLGFFSALVAFFMMVILIVLWPVYLAGLQIVTGELASGRQIRLGAALNRAAKFWPRVAVLCLIVYGVFFLLLGFAFAIGLMAAGVAGAPLLVLPILILLVLQVWLFGRWFINVLFWQQAAVLNNATVPDALRQSKEIARSGQELVWYKRPLWRGALIASIWFAFSASLELWSSWAAIRHSFELLMTTPDPQSLLTAMTSESTSSGLDLPRLCLGLIQSILRPLLGIAFVLLYFDARRASTECESSRLDGGS